jgi:hypothetical protein
MYNCVNQGCQIFRGTTYQNGIKYNKWKQNIPNDNQIYQNISIGHKIYQHYSKDPQNITKLGFFGMEIYHLATLVSMYLTTLVKIGSYMTVSVTES